MASIKGSLYYGDRRNGLLSAASGVVNTYAVATWSTSTNRVYTSLAVNVGDFVVLQAPRSQYLSPLLVVLGFGNDPLNGNAAYIDVHIKPGVSISSGGQAIRVPQYAPATFNNTITAQAWNGSVGGTAIIVVDGDFLGSGTISAVGQPGADGEPRTGGAGRGFVGGNGMSPVSSGSGGLAWSGDGIGGQGLGTAAVYNGGGGGQSVSTSDSRSGGGGGSHASAGTDGTGKFGNPDGGDGATYLVGAADASSITFGGGGGGGAIDGGGDVAGGGGGGGIVIVIAKSIDISSMIIDVRGGRGGNATYAGGGAGAGGHIWLNGLTVALGTNRALAAGASGGTSNSGGRGTGGNSGNGRITVNYFHNSGYSGSTDVGFNAYQDLNLLDDSGGFFLMM